MLQEEVRELLAQVESAKLESVRVRGVGLLSLEIWPESVHEAGCLYTGGAVWKAGLDLAHQMTSMADFSELSVLELGSGTGVAGLAAALCGAQVVLSDLPAAVSLLKRNVDRNSRAVELSGGSAKVRTLDYREPLTDSYWRTFDLIIGTDLVWQETQCAALANWCTASGAPVFLVGVPRWTWLREGLISAFRAARMSAYTPTNTALLQGLMVLLFVPLSAARPTELVPWLELQWEMAGITPSI